VVAFELLNEPEMDPMETELPYYKMAYTAVREAGMTPERVQVGDRSAVHCIYICICICIYPDRYTHTCIRTYIERDT